MPLEGLESKFDIIYADPPWRFSSNSKDKPGRNAMRHYDCMTLPEIEAMDVKYHAADDSLLLLWVTVPFAQLALRVVKAWGFEYKSQIAWDKQKAGTGFWARNEHELLYICRRGRFPCPRPAPFPWSVIRGNLREHSRKPPDVPDRVDEVWPDARKLELFARARRHGWTSWGNETDKFQEDPGKGRESENVEDPRSMGSGAGNALAHTPPIERDGRSD